MLISQDRAAIAAREAVLERGHVQRQELLRWNVDCELDPRRTSYTFIMRNANRLRVIEVVVSTKMEIGSDGGLVARVEITKVVAGHKNTLERPQSGHVIFDAPKRHTVELRPMQRHKKAA